MIVEESEYDEFNNHELVYKPGASGIEWADRHVARIDELLQPIPVVAPTGYDEIPF